MVTGEIGGGGSRSATVRLIDGGSTQIARLIPFIIRRARRIMLQIKEINIPE